MHFPISLHKHTSCIMYSTVLCISAKQAMRKETEDSGTAPKSTLSKGTHHHRARVTYQISHQTHHYSLGFSGCSWGHSVSVLQIRRAAWVASYRWSRRVILLPRGILLSSTSTNNHQRPQKKPQTLLWELMLSFLSAWNILKGQGWLERLDSKAWKQWKSLEKEGREGFVKAHIIHGSGSHCARASTPALP